MHTAYVAGLLDGEGSITLLRSGKNRSRVPVVQITMSEREPLDAIAAVFGGSVRQNRKPTENSKGMNTWQLKASAALDFLLSVKPHLRIERRQNLAALALQWSPRHDSNLGLMALRDDIEAQMKKVNQLRLDVPPVFTKHRPNAAAIAYLAGIVDGEGWISETGRIEVTTTDVELCAWLYSRFGGKTYLQSHKNKNWRTVWSWRLPPTKNQWKQQIAEQMLLRRKAERLLV